MTLEVLFFEAWGERLPLTIHETDNSGGFLQVGAVTLQKARPTLNLVAAESFWNLESDGKAYWKGGLLPKSNGSAPLEKGPFDEVLYHSDEAAVTLASRNHIRVIQDGKTSKEIQERGAGRTQAGEAFLATYQDNALHVQFSDGNTQTLAVGPEEDGNGPWVLRSADGPEWLVANHKQLRHYQPNGTLLKEEALSNENYSELFFPKRWDVNQTVAESPSSYLIAITGPDGFAVLRYAE